VRETVPSIKTGADAACRLRQAGFAARHQAGFA